MDINVLLSSCEIKQGFTTNERFYYFNNKIVVKYNVRSKNAWVQNSIKEYSNLDEKNIENKVFEYLGAKRCIFCDTSDLDKELIQMYLTLNHGRN